MSKIEKTLSIIKPDAVERNLDEAIKTMFISDGFKIIKEKKIKIEKSEAEQFYKVHETKPFYNDLCAYLSSGPIVVMILEKENAVLANRELMGSTNPKDAKDRELNNGDIARLYSGRGEVSLKVEVTDKVKEGIVFTTFHFPEHMVNMVTGDGKDEETKCAEYKVSAVQVQKISNKFKTEIQPGQNQAEVI